MSRRGVREPDRQQGSVTLEFVVIVPLLMLLVWIAMQLVMVFFANRVALAAAQEGVRSARDRGGNVTAAERRSRPSSAAPCSSIQRCGPREPPTTPASR